MRGIPESRSVRVTPRGKGQTSYWKALKVANDTLVVSHTTPRPANQERTQQRNEEILGRNWKPQRPMIYAKLDMRPFQSRDQFLETLETDYVKPVKETKVSRGPSKRQERAAERSAIAAKIIQQIREG